MSVAKVSPLYGALKHPEVMLVEPALSVAKVSPLYGALKPDLFSQRLLRLGCKGEPALRSIETYRRCRRSRWRHCRCKGEPALRSIETVAVILEFIVVVVAKVSPLYGALKHVNKFFFGYHESCCKGEPALRSI